MKLDYCEEINKVFDQYIDSSVRIINEKIEPEVNSQAKNELNDPIFKQYIGSAISLLTTFREIAADNLFGIQRSLTIPVLSYAPFLLFRGLVEISTLSLWFGSIKINAVERTRRYFIYRNDSLLEQMKFLKSIDDNNNHDIVQQKIIKLTTDSETLGINIFTKNLHQKKVLPMPTTTSIISEMLNAESTYRLFSAISHGQHWAIFQSSFKKTKTDIDIFPGIKGGLLEKNIDPISLIYLCGFSIEYLTISEIEQFKYFGWDERPLVKLIHEAKMQLKRIADYFEIPINAN